MCNDVFRLSLLSCSFLQWQRLELHLSMLKVSFYWQTRVFNLLFFVVHPRGYFRCKISHKSHPFPQKEYFVTQQASNFYEKENDLVNPPCTYCRVVQISCESHGQN